MEQGAIGSVEIEALKHELRSAIAVREKDAGETIPDYLCLNNLKSKLSRLETVGRNLAIEKYTLVFIGTIGEGKTTAICHLFNLVGEFSTTKMVGSKSRSITETQELLATGSGRTTICEVMIESAEKTSIEVEPFSPKEMEGMILDFCDSLSDVPATGHGERKSMLSKEVDTAIRNVIRLPRTTTTSGEGEKGSPVRVDRAKEELERSGIDGLKRQAMENAGLAERTETTIAYDGQEDERVWLKKTFARVNTGELPKVAIPRRMIVRVSPAILAGSPLGRFQAVIDTKGIDENPIRKDLEEYAGRENTICLFVTNFKDAPEANIRELMRYYLSSKSRDFHHRFVTLVLPHKGEPEKTNGGDGSWETGIDIRREDVQSAFRNLGLEFFPKNILFYDALKCYRSGSNVLDADTYEQQDVVEGRLNCLEEVSGVIARRRQILQDEAARIRTDFRRIQDGETLSAGEINALEAAVVQIRGLRALGTRVPKFVYGEVVERFVNYYRAKYPAWNTKHAINRRFGTYDARNFDIFYDAKVVTQGESDEEMLRKFTRETREEVEKTLNRLGETNEALEVFVPELVLQFGESYDNFVASVGEDIRDFMQNKLSPLSSDSPFWQALIEEKGKERKRGETYTDNVCQTILRELQSETSLDEYLEERSKARWAELIAEVLGYFGEQAT